MNNPYQTPVAAQQPIESLSAEPTTIFSAVMHALRMILVPVAAITITMLFVSVTARALSPSTTRDTLVFFMACQERLPHS